MARKLRWFNRSDKRHEWDYESGQWSTRQLYNVICSYTLRKQNLICMECLVSTSCPNRRVAPNIEACAGGTHVTIPV